MNFTKELQSINKIKQSCTICNGTGYLLKHTKNGKEFEDCECLVKVSTYLDYLEGNIPKRYWDWDLRNLTKQFKEENSEQYKYIKKYIDNLKYNIDKGIGFWLASSPGLAKSSIITHILKESVKIGKVAYFMRASHILSKKFESLQSSESKQFLNFLIEDVDILAIEEIEKIYLLESNSMPNHLFFEFLSDVYDSNKTILLSSNLPQKEVFKIFPPFISDRLSSIDYITLVGKKSGRLA